MEYSFYTEHTVGKHVGISAGKHKGKVGIIRHRNGASNNQHAIVYLIEGGEGKKFHCKNLRLLN